MGDYAKKIESLHKARNLSLEQIRAAKCSRCKERGNARRKLKQEKATLLLTNRRKRTDKQQLERLDVLLGKGKGAKKERERLNSENNLTV